MNYQTTFTLTPDPGFTGTWGFDMALLPHPINFAWIRSAASNTPDAPVYATVLNSQLDASTHALAYKGFSNMAERWRLAYAGVTVYQDGADLANQGTMVVAQVPSEPRIHSVAGPWDSISVGEPVLYTYPRLEIWDTDADSLSKDLPNFESSQGMPNAYFGRSREGAYVPLKLTQTCQAWTSAADEVYWTFPYSRNADTQGVRVPYSTAVNDDRCFPHDSDTADRLPPAYITVNGAGPGFGVTGAPTSPMLSGNIAHISARNLALTTSYSFFFRFGIEMQVKPNSFLAPQMKLSPPYDPTAIDAYFQIARELKDAYPADYNDMGKLWDVIKTAANTALPMLAGAGPYGKAAAMAGHLMISGGDAVRRARQAGARQSGLSAAEVEALRKDAVAAASEVRNLAQAVRQRRQTKKKKKSTKPPKR